MSTRLPIAGVSWIVGTLAGAAGALLFLAGLPGGRLAGLFLSLSSLPLFLAGLGWGFPAVLAGAGTGILLLLGGGGVGSAIVFAGFSAAAPILVTRLAISGPLRGEADAGTPPGRILVALAVLGAGILLLMAAVTMAAGGFPKVIDTALHHSGADLDLVQRQLRAAGMPLDRAGLIGLLMRVLPPAFAAGWLLLSVLNALIAEEILARSGRSLRPPPYYRETRVPQATAGALLAAIVLSFAPGGLGLLGSGLLALLVVVYFFLGLAVIHAISRALPARPIALGVLYICLALFLWPALILALVGLVDQWADLRGRADRREQERQ